MEEGASSQDSSRNSENPLRVVDARRHLRTSCRAFRAKVSPRNKSNMSYHPRSYTGPHRHGRDVHKARRAATPRERARDASEAAARLRGQAAEHSSRADPEERGSRPPGSRGLIAVMTLGADRTGQRTGESTSLGGHTPMTLNGSVGFQNDPKPVMRTNKLRIILCEL